MTLAALRPNSLDSLLTNGASVAIGPDLARRILAECTYIHQRPLNEDRALLLAAAIEHGTFRRNTQIAFARLNGRLILVDGQHRLNAVDLAGRAWPMRIEIEDKADHLAVDAYYCSFDQPGGTRSLTQVSRSLGLHDADGNGLRPTTAALLVRAVPMLMIDLRRIAPNQRPRQTRDLDTKKQIALEWKPWALAYQGCLDKGIGSRTARYRAGGVFAVAIATLRHQRERALIFWSNSIRNDALRNDDPAHALHSHFLSSKRATSEYDLAEAASHAWNAFYANRSLKLVKAIGSPLKLLGTPYTGE